MDVDRIEAMEKQWAQEPPVGLLVAAFLGFKKKEALPVSKGGAQKLLEMFPNGVIGGLSKSE